MPRKRKQTTPDDTTPAVYNRTAMFEAFRLMQQDIRDALEDGEEITESEREFLEMELKDGRTTE